MGWLAPFVIAGSAAWAAGSSLYRRHRNKRRDQLFRQLAAELGGNYFEPTKRWVGRQQQTPFLEVKLGVATVRVAEEMDGWGYGHVTFAAMPLVPTFRITREGLGRASGLGQSDVVVGDDPDFDDAFVVRSRASPEVIRTLISQRVQTLLLKWFPKAELFGRGDGLVALCDQDRYQDPEQIRAAIDVVSDIARADIYGREILKQVAGRRYYETTGDFHNRTRPYITLDVPARVVVGPELADSRLETVARLRADVELPELSIAIDPSGPTDELALLPEHSGGYVRRVGQGRFDVEDGRARFTWDAIAPAPEQIRAAAELLASLLPSVGIYR